MLDDDMPMLASALAYSSFFAIPSALLVAVGLFTLVAAPATISGLVDALGGVMPAQAAELLGGSLRRLDRHEQTTIAMTAAGSALAIWATTGAMTGYMKAVNIAYGCPDRRGFVRKRAVALLMTVCILAAVALVGGLLVLGPQIEKRIGSALGEPELVAWIWWAGQWPVLVAGLLAAFATMLWLGPDLAPERRRWRLITPGAALAVAAWLAASGLFALYTARFGSYDKTWGSLSAVIVTLTWLWLSSLALLLGAELNAEVDGRDPRTPPRPRGSEADN